MNLSEMMRFLEKKLGAPVSIEVTDPVFYQCPALKLAPDQYLHHSSFCIEKKTADGNHICSRHKTECMQQCGAGTAFVQTCPFGITELVTPVRFEDRVIAVLFFDSSAGEGECRKSSRFLADLILLEVENALRNGVLTLKHRTPDFYTENCLNFIELHYSENIRLTDLTDFLKVNPNYLGGLLKSRFGKNFHALLTERRLREAKIYLRLHKHLSIGHISSLCGFADSNYFCLVFHKHCGMSPREYRNTDGEPPRFQLS